MKNDYFEEEYSNTSSDHEREEEKQIQGEQRQMAKQSEQSVKSSLFSGVKSFFTKGKKNADKNAKGRGRAQTELDFIPPKFEQQEDQMPKKKLPKNVQKKDKREPSQMLVLIL